MTEVHFTVITGSGLEFAHSLPAKMEVCDRCEGHGTHLHPAIGGHAYSPEEFNESFDDEERAEYFKRGGRYDVPCSVCKGRNVIAVVDEDACNTPRLKRLLKVYEHITTQQDTWAAEDRAIRRMESGGWE